ncbi:MAG: radical SAM protein, partial [Candidatus Shapirobacteria bacterium]
IEEFCDLKCDYCGGFYPSEYQIKYDNNGSLIMPQSWKDKMVESPEIAARMPLEPSIKDFFLLGKSALARAEEFTDVDILKLSGGEIFIYKDLCDFIEEIHQQYTAIQVLTNGVSLTPEIIGKLSNLENVYFQVSLDGVDSFSNKARSSSSIVVNKVLANIDAMQENNIGVEINTVLTKYNTADFESMLEHFKDAKNLVIVPRPVRGEPKETLVFSSKQSSVFKELINNKQSKYHDILPPQAYLNRLQFIMDNGQRDWDCYVPFFVMGMDNYGTVDTCPCAGDLPKIGSIFTDQTLIEQTYCNNSQFNPKNNYRQCKNCIVQYEMINLYIEGLVSAQEMRKLPSFKFSGVLENIDQKKNELVTQGIIAS